MKAVFTLALVLFMSFSLLSQSPESFNYQAAVRDSEGMLLTNQNVGIRISINLGAADGLTIYQETFSATTSSLGLINIGIGSGSVLSGTFSSIDWSNGPFFIETALDLSGGSSFTVLGASQLLSVPFALYAKTSGSSTPGPEGPMGEDGRTILSGSTNPSLEGEDGDFYLNTSTMEFFGPRAAGIWGAGAPLKGSDGSNGADGANGVNGHSVLSGDAVPTTEGADGDFYISTSTNELYGPKTSGIWGVATSLIGPAGTNGTDGIDGRTLLNGSIVPTSEGEEGDFYLNTSTNEIYGPKVSGVWGSGTSLVGVAGVNGADGTNGRTLLNGTTAPTTEGEEGDFYLNTSSNEIYGPKASGVWGAGTSLVGAAGTNGADGTDGRTLLNGTTAPTTEGEDSDFYLNTSTNEIYGPKASGVWGPGTSIIGTQGPQGPAGSGGSDATYRWATFHSYSNASGHWSMSNDPNFHGGVAPSSWTDGSAIASDMSSDKEVLRTLFQQKGYATNNALIMNDEWASYSSTNGKVVLALFRVENTTANPIVWEADILYSCYGAWGEKASVALNGVSEMNETAIGTKVVSLTIPANRTSTIIFVSTSGPPSVTPSLRTLRLAFRNNSLNLPAGLQFVDDLDTATGGWEQ